ncbi:beta-galactosidase/beta-glucuronidase [Crossiella equi]|uniref:Beta-galactosidase/beta-glucuronidase n=1 Tax=Crossiella equi TaxID=130796 RepID=A0ABS5A7T7_9PSEU|nr:sugar-binding domain-containing protein [Crossiella equi]MBP2472651.1 beta-galactosidase/beta-glucuronidase [Crossiella equi]
MTAAHLAAADHPRPQLIRDHEWSDLSGPWGFAHDDTDTGLASGWHRSADPFDRQITVPYPPESKRSGVADRGFHPIVWYRREFTAAVPAPGRALLLHFGAVDYRASVWVNGQFVGAHEGGHTGFSLDVTGALDASGTQVVTVRAEDRPQDTAQPRGKQDWQAEPHVIWYHRTTGIWQPVWLEEVPALRVDSLHWTPELPHSRVRCELALNTWPATPHTVEVELRLGEEVLAVQSVRLTGRELSFDITVPALRNAQDQGRLLWSPEHPNLVDAVLRLRTAEGTDADQVSSYFGFATAGTADRRFLWNGRPYFLRFALAQNYWPESHLAASAAELRREVELAKSLGLNGIRVHQKIEDPRFLYWCDRLGLLVWEEMPSAFEFGTTTAQRVVAEWTEAIHRDRSHPCIAAWVPLNESWGVPDIATQPAQRDFAKALYHLTKSLDPTRPTISNDGWEIAGGDFWGVHDYQQDPAILASRYGSDGLRSGEFVENWPNLCRLVLPGEEYSGQPIILTEFGGANFVPAEGEEVFGYGRVASAEEYERLLEAQLRAVRSGPLAGFCFTQLTDTEQETNGLLDERREPKLPVETFRRFLG